MKGVCWGSLILAARPALSAAVFSKNSMRIKTVVLAFWWLSIRSPESLLVRNFSFSVLDRMDNLLKLHIY